MACRCKQKKHLGNAVQGLRPSEALLCGRQQRALLLEQRVQGALIGTPGGCTPSSLDQQCLTQQRLSALSSEMLGGLC